jgi:hypothetical protein
MQDITADNYDMVRVDYYNPTELQAIVNFYKAHGLLSTEFVQTSKDASPDNDTHPDFILKLLTLTGGNAKILARSATSFL